MFDSGNTYVERKFGEMTVGKIYELDRDQVASTDSYMGKHYKRVNTKIGETLVDVYIGA